MFDPTRKEDFDRLAGITEKSPGRGFVDRLFGRWIPPETPGSMDWVSSADWANIQQEPVRARAVLWIIFATFILLILWSAFAPLDEVTRGVGKVVPSSGTHIIQSVDGGVVEKIMVKEAQLVKEGDLLLKIDPTRFVSSLGAKNIRAMALKARKARLRALLNGEPFDPPEEVVKAVPDIVEQEKDYYQTSRNSMESQLNVARERLQQIKQELGETKARLNQARRSYDLAARELEVTEPLLETGAISELDVIRLKREMSAARGEMEESRARASRIRSGIEEAQGMISEVEMNFNTRWRKELTETMGEIAGLFEGSRALQDRVTHSEIRSPVDGTVKRLFVNTLGGVVMPGGEVVEVVPLEDDMVVEAKIAPRDRAFLSPGQDAVVKFTAYEYAIYGGLDAVVEHISADTITERNGQTYYLVRVRTHKSSFGDGLPVLPGMMAQVDILTGKKTVLAYIMKPLLRAKANALSER